MKKQKGREVNYKKLQEKGDMRNKRGNRIAWNEVMRERIIRELMTNNVRDNELERKPQGSRARFLLLDSGHSCSNNLSYSFEY